MKEVKVSIIIPVYNVEKYLVDCLESVFKQTLSNIEIIAVNDGSTDLSLEILNKYAGNYNNMIIINQENKGQSAARNIGLKTAKGKYIYFLDSDDIIDINLVKECYNVAEKNNLDIVNFDAKVFCETDELKNRYNFDYTRKYKLASNIKGGREFYLEMRQKKAYSASICIQFYKKEFLMKNEMFFKEGIIHEDELFTISLLFKNPKVIYIPKEYFYRRVREGSTMTNLKGIKNIEGYIYVIEQLRKIYHQYKLINIEKTCLLENINELYNFCIGIVYDMIESNKEDSVTINRSMEIIRTSVNNKDILNRRIKLKVKFFNLSYYIWKIKKQIRRGKL